MAQAGIAPSDVAAICLDTTCCTVVALDAAGEALRPALLWCGGCGAPGLSPGKHMQAIIAVDKT